MRGRGEPQAGPCLPALARIAAPREETCPVVRPSEPDLLDAALDAVALDRCTAGLLPADRRVLDPDGQGIWRDPFRLPFHDRVHFAPLSLPGFASRLGVDLDRAAAGALPVAAALAVAMHHLGWKTAAARPGGSREAGRASTPGSWGLGWMERGRSACREVI